MRPPPESRLAFAPAGLVAAALAAAPLAAAPPPASLPASIDLAPVPYVQSETCIRCHPDHHASWKRTFHRTMTQPAGEGSVLGDFSGTAAHTYEGVTSRFYREPDGRYVIETLGPSRAVERFEVVMCVGSRRIQQYVARLGSRHYRLPVAWNIEEKQWFHLNGGFLHPDGSDPLAHFSLWDANCIFCHNTKPNPGMDWTTQAFASRVEEMGIACEACHGPGGEHIARNRDPLRRYRHHLTGRQDPTIWSPLELPKERQVQVCGHCHGQRLPHPRERIEQFLALGDPYTPGDDLSEYTAPIRQDSHLEGVDLALRFWGDGTPRLTAYEYQGLLMSPDYQKGELTCLSCHSMHGGDPRGMIEPVMRGADACRDCHADLVRDGARHARHEPGGTGDDCYACHMPRIAYGLLETHPTHRMQNPDPARAWRHDMPEACTLCHTNRTAAWAAVEMAKQYGKPAPAAAELPGGPAFAVAENVRALLAGDVLQRAVAIEAFARENTYEPDPVRRLWAAPFLMEGLRDDYPALRFMAWRALRRLVERAGRRDGSVARSAAGLPRFDPQGDPASRAEAVAAWQAWWSALDKSRLGHPGAEVPLDASLRPDRATVEALRRMQVNRLISIGE